MSGPGSRRKGWPPFGPLRVRILPSNAGVGVISMRGALVALRTSASAQLKRFFDCGRAVRCLLPLGAGRFMHLVVWYGYQGADTDAKQLALTEQLFNAALGELGVASRGAALHACW